MKKIIITLLLISAGLTSFAENPKWAAKASKSIFTLTTFNADGILIASSNGFFIGENGEAISNYAPFRNATKAVIIDASGKKYDVVSMLGANDIYDVAKFRVNTKKSVPLTIAAQPSTEGSDVWLMPYTVKKEANCIQGKVKKAEKFKDNYTYYTFSLTAPENTVSCPFMNANGEVIGLMQQPAKTSDTLSYGICTQYGADMKISGLSINEAALQATNIKTEIPDDPDQALVYIYMAAGGSDSSKFVSVINDYIAKYPDSPEGYTYRAQNETNNNDFASAEKDMNQAIKVAKKKDDDHYSYSKLIFQKEIIKSNIPYAGWSFDKAASEATEAYNINPLPIYRNHLAQIYFAQKKYQEACDIYMELTKTNLRSAQLFYSAARCKELMKSDTTAIYALLDSAVNIYTKPYLKEASPYILARAEYLMKMKRYREAVNDYNEYEKVMIADVNANFYYVREQAELKGRLFKQALDDIAKAISMKPIADYYAEQSSLQLRVNMVDEAIASAKECIRLAPDYSDGYLFLGLSLIEKKNKEEGIKNLKKAKELGDTQADALIEKYSK